tara:strand:+ start:305 stop:622 length:318 start_codon:yes stop_codon:yes gene_type:complete
MSKSLKVKDVIQQAEKVFGRQSENYMLRLINDSLLDIGEKKQHKISSVTSTLESYKRWYDLSDDMIDVIRVEIKDTDDRYVVIPRLTDPHNLLREDTDSSDDTLT